MRRDKHEKKFSNRSGNGFCPEHRLHCVRRGGIIQ